MLESSKVTDSYWGEGYGSPVNEDGIRDFFNISSKDLVISYPSEMGIDGDNIYDDTVTLIERLGLESEFNIPKIKELKYRESRNNY